MSPALQMFIFTWSQDRVPALPADHVTHLLQNNILHQNEDRSDLVREHVGVGGCCQPLAGQGDDVQPARQLVEEVGVTWGGGRWMRTCFKCILCDTCEILPFLV